MRRWLWIVLAVLWLPAAPAAAADKTVRLAPPLYVKGMLTYRSRVALPGDSVAVVELREISESADGKVVAEKRMPLDGAQVPIPFELEVTRTRLEVGKRYAVRGGILTANRPSWVSASVPVETAQTLVDAGTLTLVQVRLRTFATIYECGDTRVSVEFPGGTMRMTVGLQEFEMKRLDAGSGARYEAISDPGTSFWADGEGAMLVLKGRTYPECRRVR